MKHLIFLLLVPLFYSCQTPGEQGLTVAGELQQWHKVTLILNGPETSEWALENPFLNFKLSATFSYGSKTYTVPGYFAADGNAGESSASEGNVWKIHFRPDEVGRWKYKVSFRAGKNVSILDGEYPGEPLGLDGLEGILDISESTKSGPDFRSKGRIVNGGMGYFIFQGTDEVWIKNGTDSPENFLAFSDFDQTYRFSLNTEFREGEADPKKSLHKFEPHLTDWKEGDPTWQDGKGKAMASYIKTINPFQSNVILHTHSDDQHQDEYLTPMLGFEYLDGPSMQVGDPAKVHSRIKKWVEESQMAGDRWIVNLDEIGPAKKGVIPDSFDADHDTIRNQCL